MGEVLVEGYNKSLMLVEGYADDTQLLFRLNPQNYYNKMHFLNVNETTSLYFKK